jgi:hypothetical protein
MAVLDKTTAAIANEQEASASYTWTLITYQEQGNLCLKWHTTSPFRAQQGKIAVYNGQSFPADASKDIKKSSWDNENGGGSGWNTGLTYGSDWYCAWIAEKSPNGPYTYVVKLVTKG